MPRREGHPVIGANRLRKPKFLECPLEDGERKFLLSCGQRFARQEIPGRIVGDRERITVLSIAELKLAFVVSAPEGIRLCGPRELGAGGPGGTTPATPLYQAMAIEDRVDRADRGEVDAEWLATQLLADLGRAPARIFTLQPDDHRFDGRREPIRLPIRPSAAIGKCAKPTVLVPLENLVAGLAGDPELRAQRRHLFALEQAGDKPQPLVHDVTLLPRHAPSCEGSKSFTHVSGILCYLSLRKDTSHMARRFASGRRAFISYVFDLPGNTLFTWGGTGNRISKRVPASRLISTVPRNCVARLHTSCMPSVVVFLKSRSAGKPIPVSLTTICNKSGATGP